MMFLAAFHPVAWFQAMHSMFVLPGGGVNMAGIGTVVAIICTLAIFSLVFRENAFYRLFERIYIGLAAGYSLQIVIREVIDPLFIKPVFIEGKWWGIFAALAGIMFYFVYSKKLNWISRIPIGLIMGMSAGQIFQIYANTMWPQLEKSFLPLNPFALGDSGAAIGWVGVLNNFIFVIVMLAVMSYFFFSFKQENKAIKFSATSGRMLLMIAFGALFGSTIMARLSLLYERLFFITIDGLHLDKLIK